MRILKKLSIIVCATLAFLFIFEVIVECFGFIPIQASPLVIWAGNWDPNFGTPEAAFQESFDTIWEPKPGAVLFGEKINEDGYRGTRFPLAKNSKFRIVTMGDSSTMGFAIREEDAWSRRLEAELRDRGYDVELINFGVVGFCAVQGLRLYERKVRYYSPDLVIVAFGALNDIVQVTAGAAAADRARVCDSLKFRIHYYATRFTIFRWLEGLSGRASAEEKSRHAAITAGGAATVHNVSIAEFEDCYTKICEAQRRAGKAFAIVCPPRMERVEATLAEPMDYKQTIHRAAQKLNVPLAEVYDFFRAYELQHKKSADLLMDLDYYVDTVHPSVKAGPIYAKIVADALEKGGALTASPRRSAGK